MQGKIARLETQLFRTGKKAQEKEELVVQLRSQNFIKCRSLFKAIQDLRRQYAGSVPLAQQEKLSRAMVSMADEKKRTAAALKDAEEKLNEIDEKSEELRIKQEGLDELMSSLKAGKASKQALEWQKKLEDLRLRDMRSRRSAEQWAKEVATLRDLSKSQSVKIGEMEEEIIKLENRMEQKQLDWEAQEAELETLKDDTHGDEAEKGDEVVDLGSSMGSGAGLSVDYDLPLAKQLENALKTVKKYADSIEGKVHLIKCPELL